jgi:hypothetical protein
MSHERGLRVTGRIHLHALSRKPAGERNYAFTCQRQNASTEQAGHTTIMDSERGGDSERLNGSNLFSKEKEKAAAEAAA